MRAFCAIPIHDSLRNEIRHLQQRLGKELTGVRWSRVENLHLTLRFFEEVEAESLEKAAKVMLSVGALVAPFTLEINRLGAFPTPTRPRVLWAGFKNSDAMRLLHARIEHALNEVGIPPERRPYSPHLTLGRARGKLPDITALLQRYSSETWCKLPVERVVVYRSRLLPQGAEHTELHSIKLNGPDS